MPEDLSWGSPQSDPLADIQVAKQKAAEFSFFPPIPRVETLFIERHEAMRRDIEEKVYAELTEEFRERDSQFIRFMYRFLGITGDWQLGIAERLFRLYAYGEAPPAQWEGGRPRDFHESWHPIIHQRREAEDPKGVHAPAVCIHLEESDWVTLWVEGD
jgi:hypothetical protein